MKPMKRFLPAVLLSVLSLASCGGPPPVAPDAVNTPTPSGVSRPGLSVSQELGKIDRAAADQAFERVKSRLVACHQEALKRIDYVAGDAKFFARVDPRGKVRWIYFEESTFGDRELEKCLLSALSSAPWPSPEGGDGEIQKPFGFDSDAREPTPWGPEKAAAGVASIQGEVSRCRGEASGLFQVTVYVEPSGKVGSAGIAAPNKDVAEKADCVLQAVRTMTFPSPGSYAAKVTFSL